MNSTMTDQIDQIEKPTCSAITDQMRLRRAIVAPPLFQASTSSEFQSSMSCLRDGICPTVNNRYFVHAARGDRRVTCTSHPYQREREEKLINTRARGLRALEGDG